MFIEITQSAADLLIADSSNQRFPEAQGTLAMSCAYKVELVDFPGGSAALFLQIGLDVDSHSFAAEELSVDECMKLATEHRFFISCDTDLSYVEQVSFVHEIFKEAEMKHIEATANLPS